MREQCQLGRRGLSAFRVVLGEDDVQYTIVFSKRREALTGCANAVPFADARAGTSAVLEDDIFKFIAGPITSKILMRQSQYSK